MPSSKKPDKMTIDLASLMEEADSMPSMYSGAKWPVEMYLFCRYSKKAGKKWDDILVVCSREWEYTAGKTILSSWYNKARKAKTYDAQIDKLRADNLLPKGM